MGSRIGATCDAPPGSEYLRDLYNNDNDLEWLRNVLILGIEIIHSIDGAGAVILYVLVLPL